jgi:hypothetical protein
LCSLPAILFGVGFVFLILQGEEASVFTDDEVLRYIMGCTGDTEPESSITAAEPTSAAAPMVGANALAAVAVAVAVVVVVAPLAAGRAKSSRSWSVPACMRASSTSEAGTTLGPNDTYIQIKIQQVIISTTTSHKKSNRIPN